MEHEFYWNPQEVDAEFREHLNGHNTDQTSDAPNIDDYEHKTEHKGSLLVRVIAFLIQRLVDLQFQRRQILVSNRNKKT